MGFLSRLSSRARLDTAPAPLAMPKGVVARRPLPPSHATMPPAGDDFSSPRAAPTGERQDRRTAEVVETPLAPDEPARTRPSVVQHAESAAPPMVHRQVAEQDEDDAVMLRRQVEEEQEEVQTSVHREVEEQREEAVQASSTVRRSLAAPTHAASQRPGLTERSREFGRVPLTEDRETGIARHPSPEDSVAAAPQLAQPVPDTVRAPEMRVIEAAEVTPSPSMEFGRPADFFRAARDAAADRSAPFDRPDASAPAPAPAPGRERPQVVIDQIDVLIHEPAAPATPAPRTDADRSLRARYLRRL